MSYDIAIIRSDIPDDIAFMVSCDWQDRGLEYLDTVGTSCNPTYNYARFFQAFHVRPTTDLHGKSAIVVKDMLDDALKEIGKHSIDELEQKYFLDNNGKVIRWGSIPNAIQWLRDVRDYCEQNPGYKFIGRDAEIPGRGSASLGTVRTFSPATWWKRWARSPSPTASPTRTYAKAWANASDDSGLGKPVGRKPWRRTRLSTDWRNCPTD